MGNGPFQPTAVTVAPGTPQPILNFRRIQTDMKRMNLSYTEQPAHVAFQLSLLQLAMIPGPNGTTVPDRVKQEVKELERYVDKLAGVAKR